MLPVQTIFSHVRQGRDHRMSFNLLANRIHHAVTRKLNSRYGHENEVDLYDHPEACILVTGQAAAARIAAYTPHDSPAPAQRARQWTLALRAYALSIDHTQGNLLHDQVAQHGDDRHPPFMPSDEQAP